MKIIQVKQSWPDDRLLINFQLHNLCNYRCWYCFPNSNTGTYKWKDYDLILSNFIHLLNIYKLKLNKSKFQINLLGGEPTLWPELPKFCQDLKNIYKDDVSIMITSNGSRNISWWMSNVNSFDHVLLSCHPEYVNEEHILHVADLLYDHNVHVDISVLMAPNLWDRSVDVINFLKTGNKKWAIIASYVQQSLYSYSDEQLSYVNDYLKQRPNMEWYKTVKKEHHYTVNVTYDDLTCQQVSKVYILLNKLNNFYGWKCNIGVDNITILFNGDISANCEENLYNINFKYNLYDSLFTLNFNPEIKETTCSKCFCGCEHEYNTSKYLKK